MKNVTYLIFLIAAVFTSCAKEINSELAVNDPKAEAFMRGEQLGERPRQFYFIKRSLQNPEARPTEVLRKYSQLSMHNRGADKWEAVHPAFSQAVSNWLNDEAKRQDHGILGGIEVTSYVFLTNYLFQAEKNEALSNATAFYLKTLLELGEASEWGILARALTISQDVLKADEYKTIARHIRKNATDILKNGADESFSEEQKVRQVEAAKQAIAILESNKS